MKKEIFILVLSLFTIFSFAQSENKRISEFNLDKNLALQGYDPVAYFKQSKALKGIKEYSINYEGVEYRFSSSDNKKIFLKTPAKYEPEFGGWCAYAIGISGEKVSVNPKTFKIVDGKLYLFYNAFFNNTLEDWNKDEAYLKSKANANWKKIIH